MAFLMHPPGGSVGVWQAGHHNGAELVNEPGAFTWNQLHTRDQEGAAGFYNAVFGWNVTDFGGMPMFTLGQNGVATAIDMPPGTPDEVPAYWMVIFGAADTDATAAKAAELGGQVAVGPFDIQGVGRFAVLADPQGVYFGVISLAREHVAGQRRHPSGGHSVRRRARVPRSLQKPKPSPRHTQRRGAGDPLGRFGGPGANRRQSPA